MSDWESVKQAQNLVRHSKSGMYYLRAKVLGKIIRRSLSTKSLKIAKQKRDHLLPILRKSAELNKSKSKSNATTLTEALTIASERHIEKPGIKASTIGYWKEIHKSTSLKDSSHITQHRTSPHLVEELHHQRLYLKSQRRKEPHPHPPTSTRNNPPSAH